MKKENLKLSKEAKFVLRKTAIKLLFEEKMKKGKVQLILGVSSTFITNCYQSYIAEGESGIIGSKNIGGRPKKDNNVLTPKEYKKLEKVLDCEPRKHKQLHLDFGLWTIKMVQCTIKELFGKEMKRWKVRDLLIEMGYSNQVPLFRAYQQNPKKVTERIETTLPLIKNEAEEEKREIMYGDEAGFRSTDQRGKTRAKKGKTPIVRVTGHRFSINAISCIGPKGDLRFMAYEGSFNSDKLIEFLQRLVYKSTKKTTLILDGHPSHKTNKVKDYLKSIDNQIKIYYLPGYSPELNPDEQVWNQVEHDLKGQIIASKQVMIDKVKRSLYRLQKNKDKVSNYFRHPEVKYM